MDERTEDVRNKLAAEIYERFMELYNKLPECVYLNEYKKRLMWQGERILIHSCSGINNKTPALLLGVDENCSLRVRYDDGREEIISSGEISIGK